MTILGSVEIGGTKTDMAVGTSLTDLTARHRIPTTDPTTTLDQIVVYFTSNPIGALGIASFGPLDVDTNSPRYGTMLATPKPGWSETSVVDTLGERLGVPIAINTDVNGAALGEARWGAAQGMKDFAYVTVGTGIGVGIVVNGHLVGASMHPEAGHVAVRRRRDDRHGGSCPYHGDCLEGMAAGPALEARFGSPDTWPDNDSVLDVVTDYVAQGLCNLVYTIAPERIIVGGGVSTLPYFHDRLRTEVRGLLADYPREPDVDLMVSKPGLDTLSGLAGGLILAEGAARATESGPVNA